MSGSIVNYSCASSVQVAYSQVDLSSYSERCDYYGWQRDETHSRIAVRYRAAGANKDALGAGEPPALDILSLRRLSASASSSESFIVEYASHLRRSIYSGDEALR